MSKVTFVWTLTKQNLFYDNPNNKGENQTANLYTPVSFVRCLYDIMRIPIWIRPLQAPLLNTVEKTGVYSICEPRHEKTSI